MTARIYPYHNLGSADAFTIRWFAQDLTEAERAQAQQLGALEIRVEVGPDADASLSRAMSRIDEIVWGLCSPEALGRLLLVKVGDAPGPSSRVRLHRGQFWDFATVRAGRRLEVELPHGSAGASFLLSFAAVDERNWRECLAVARDPVTSVLLFAASAHDAAWWTGLTSAFAGCLDVRDRSIRVEHMRLATRLQEQRAVMMRLLTGNNGEYANACLYFDRAQWLSVENAIRGVLPGAVAF